MGTSPPFSDGSVRWDWGTAAGAAFSLSGGELLLSSSSGVMMPPQRECKERKFEREIQSYRTVIIKAHSDSIFDCNNNNSYSKFTACHWSSYRRPRFLLILVSSSSFSGMRRARTNEMISSSSSTPPRFSFLLFHCHKLLDNIHRLPLLALQYLKIPKVVRQSRDIFE